MWRALGAVLATGCSYTMLAGNARTTLPVDDPQYECSTAAPIVDTAIAVPIVALATYLIVKGTAEHLDGNDQLLEMTTGGPRIVVGVIVSAIGAPFSISAIHGWRRYARCRRLLASSDRDWATAYAAYADQLAASGDCHAAFTIGATVFDRDREVYDHDYLQRPAIVQCRNDEQATRAGKQADLEQRERHDQAMVLAKQAHAAAERGECVKAHALVEQIDALDGTVRKTSIDSDAMIASCKPADAAP